MTHTQPAPEASTESKRQQLAISQTITLIRTENKNTNQLTQTGLSLHRTKTATDTTQIHRNVTRCSRNVEWMRSQNTHNEGGREKKS